MTNGRRCKKTGEATYEAAETGISIMTQSEQMQRLNAVLETYGADPARWPTVDRHQLEALVAANEQARALLKAEAALDRLLATAPLQADRQATERATSSLLARLDDEPPGDTGAEASNVVPFARKSGTQPTSRVTKTTSSAPGLVKELMVLAAALLIGFFTVSQGLLEGAGFDLAGESVASSETYDVGDIALGSADEGEEDLL